MTKKQIKQIEEFVDKVNREEIRARKYAKALRLRLDREKLKKIIDDYEIEVTFQAFSYDEEFCKSKSYSVVMNCAIV